MKITTTRRWCKLIDHYQILPKLSWSTEVYMALHDYTWKKWKWCFSFYISFNWLGFFTGAGIGGDLWEIKK